MKSDFFREVMTTPCHGKEHARRPGHCRFEHWYAVVAGGCGWAGAGMEVRVQAC